MINEPKCTSNNSLIVHMTGVHTMSHDRYAKCVENRHSRRAILSGIASTLGVSLMSPWSHVLEAAPASKATKA